MKNKTSGKLYIQTLKQLVIPAVVIGSVCIVASVLNMLNPDMSMPIYRTQRLITGRYFTKFYGGKPIAAAVAPALIVFMYVGSAVFTYVSFKHLNSRPASDFYHSLPCTRISGFVSRILAVLTLQYGIILISMGVSVLTMKTSGVPFDVSFIPKLILSYMAGSTLIVGGIALAMSLTGNLAANAMMALVILVLPRTLLFIAGRMITHANYYGFINISTMGMFLNPVNNIPIAALMDLTRIWEYYGLSETLISIQAAIYSFVLGIIYLGLALFTMKSRKSEIAGNGVGSDVMRHALSALVAFPFLAFAFHSLIKYGVFKLNNSANIQQLCVFFAVGFVVFMVSEFILKRNIISALKSLPVFLAAGVLAFALIFVQKEAALNINNKVPDLEDIKYVKIDHNGSINYKYKPLYNYSNLMTKDIEFTDRELLSILRGNLERRTKEYDTRRRVENTDISHYQEIFCEFKLNNGRSIFREVSLYNDTLEKLWKLISITPEYKRLSVALPPAEEVDDVSINYNQSLEESYIKEFYELFKNEFEALPTVTKNEIMNEQYHSLYQRFHDTYGYVPLYTPITNFGFSGTIGGYGFRSSFGITSRVPETAKSYMRKINSIYKEQFFGDLEVMAAEENPNSSVYYIELEILNFDRDGNSPHQGFPLYYYSMNSEENIISLQDLNDVLCLVEKNDLCDVGFNSPIVVINIRKKDVDPDYALNYRVYVQLSMEEAEELFEAYMSQYD